MATKVTTRYVRVDPTEVDRFVRAVARASAIWSARELGIAVPRIDWFLPLSKALASLTRFGGVAFEMAERQGIYIIGCCDTSEQIYLHAWLDHNQALTGAAHEVWHAFARDLDEDGASAWQERALDRVREIAPIVTQLFAAEDSRDSLMMSWEVGR